MELGLFKKLGFGKLFEEWECGKLFFKIKEEEMEECHVAQMLHAQGAPCSICLRGWPLTAIEQLISIVRHGSDQEAGPHCHQTFAS